MRTRIRQILGIKDTPHAVALGVAVGVFFGFVPLVGLKTLLAVGVSRLLRGSMLAAAIAVTLHDVLLPVAPLLLRWEYDLGYFLLSRPHQWPPHMHLHVQNLSVLFHWSTFFTLGRPLLVGSIVLGAPVCVVSYYITLWWANRRSRSPGGADRRSHP